MRALLLALAALASACSQPGPEGAGALAHGDLEKRGAPGSHLLPMELPACEGSADLAAIETVAVATDGGVYLDGEPTTPTALAKRRWPSAHRAIVVARPDAPHGRVVLVLAALRAAGVRRYGLVADTPDGPIEYLRAGAPALP